MLESDLEELEGDGIVVGDQDLPTATEASRGHSAHREIGLHGLQDA